MKYGRGHILLGVRVGPQSPDGQCTGLPRPWWSCDAAKRNRHPRREEARGLLPFPSSLKASHGKPFSFNDRLDFTVDFKRRARRAPSTPSSPSPFHSDKERNPFWAGNRAGMESRGNKETALGWTAGVWRGSLAKYLLAGAVLCSPTRARVEHSNNGVA